MAYDLKRTHSSLILTRPIAAGTTVEQEGLLMVRVIEDGVEKVAIDTSVDGSEEVVGYVKTADSLPDRTSSVEVVTVPASGALEVDLRNTNLVSGRVRAQVVSTGQVLTVDNTFAGNTADDQVKVDLAAGRLKFHADEAGEQVKMTYLYDLTLEEAKQRFGERHINNRGLHAIHGVVELGTGIGELYTDQYDPTQDYTSAAALTLGDNGIITKGGAGPALDAKVVSVPSESNPLLGVRFNFQV